MDARETGVGAWMRANPAAGVVLTVAGIAVTLLLVGWVASGVFGLGRGTPDERFLDNVREQAPETERLDDKVILDLGHASCDALDAGLFIEDIPTDGYAEGVMLGAAIRDLCPKYGDEMESDLERNGL